MALGTITDPNSLSQGGLTAVSDLVFGAPAGNAVTITSTGAELPLLIDNEYFEIRDHSQTVNNGLYRVADATPATNSIDVEKVSGSNPIAAASEAATVLSSIRDAVADMVFSGTSGRSTVISAGGNLPSLSVGSRFDVEDHSDPENNGTFEVTEVTTLNEEYVCTKLDPSTDAPVDAASEAATTVSEGKTVFYDVAALEIYLLEQWGMDLDGVLGQPFYSFTVISWKDDDFLIANAPVPMLTIDADAGKYLIGQDPSGNNSGWAPRDNGTFSIRTRKLWRNMGWSEVGADGDIAAQYSGIRTLGSFADPTPGTGDRAYYQFGSDTTVDDTVPFEFTGPVNEAIQSYDGLATPADGVTGFAIATNDTITRNDGGNWRDDGYVVGGQIEILDAEDPANDGTYVIVSVDDAVDGDLVVFGTPLTNNAADTTVRFAVDNRNEVTLRLRVRSTAGLSSPRTFSQANLAAAGETSLSNRLFTFGLANAEDLDITASDASIDADTPYTGMSITYFATPQSQGGAGDLVGGPYDFGIIIDGNGGTNAEVYEWGQRQFRKTTDIDADGDVAIGVTMDGLMRFVGPTLQVGSVDGGNTFPRNPDGGGSGVFITDLNASSRNNTVYYDNLGLVRQHPVSVPVTIDFNSTLEADGLAEFALLFDHTIRTSVADLVITADTGANGTFDSAGANLPATLDAGAGAYVRISGLVGADEAMNGIYQVTALTSTSQWDVTRYDGATIDTTSSAAADIDEHAIDTPDFIIVEDSVASPVQGLVSGTDFAFSFDYSNNSQGGRTPGTDADVVARAIGQGVAQHAQSTVQTISSTALVIPVTAQIERNFFNP
jgi:hypothetical protein